MRAESELESIQRSQHKTCKSFRKQKTSMKSKSFFQWLFFIKITTLRFMYMLGKDCMQNKKSCKKLFEFSQWQQIDKLRIFEQRQQINKLHIFENQFESFQTIMLRTKTYHWHEHEPLPKRFAWFAWPLKFRSVRRQQATDVSLGTHSATESKKLLNYTIQRNFVSWTKSWQSFPSGQSVLGVVKGFRSI